MGAEGAAVGARGSGGCWGAWVVSRVPARTWHPFALARKYVRRRRASPFLMGRGQGAGGGARRAGLQGFVCRPRRGWR